MYRIEKPKLIIAILMVVILVLQIIPINSESYSKAQECAQICKTVIDENGDIWKITVAYGDDAQIPDGSELRVTEIAEGSDEYNSWYRQTIEALSEDHDDGKKSLVLSAACFFDIEIIDNKGYKIEPAAPVEVRIDHEEGFALSQNESLRVIHFAESGTEIIDDLCVNKNGTEIVYAQNSFSVIGAIAVTNSSNWPTQNGQYVVVLQRGDDYYAVAQDGTLRKVKYFNDTISFLGSGTTNLGYINDYLWYFTASGSTRGYLSTEAGTTGDGIFIDPYSSTGLGTTHRQLRSQNNMIYATNFVDGSVHYYTLSASAGDGGKITQTDLYGDEGSQVYYVPYSSFTANGNETELFTQVDVEAMIEKWRRQMTQDLTVNKTAEVYDYDNRIYRVDIEASSGYYEISPSIALEFVVDCSRSMYFPSRLEQVGSFTTTTNNKDSTEAQGIRNWITENGQTDQVYYFITDPNAAADVYAIWYENSKGWCFGNASYYHTKDSTMLGMRGGIYGHLYNKSYYVPDPYKYDSVLGDGRHPDDLTVLNSRSFDGKIYITDPVIEGQPWNRLDYLQLAVEAAAKVVYAVDPNAQIGLVKFAADAENLGTWGSENQEQFYNALREISVIGGTDPRDGLMEVVKKYNDNNDKTRQQVVLLITDGAPNKCTWDEARAQANILKSQTVAGKKTEIYTLGLSLENVGANKQELFTVSSGEGFQYDAESGPEIVDCITNIIQDVVIQANLIGNVTDVIDSAFYPVDKSNGMPLSHGDSITLEGNKTSQNDDNAAGQVVNDNGVWKIVWNDQKFDWPTTDEDGNIILPGWHGTVYVKSKEDFLGGNGISTNGDGSIVEAVRYVDHAENEVELPNSETGNSVELSTPYVNVDELTFSENDTEWTVYLGTEVEPLKEIQALFEEIKVYEVVSKTTGGHVIADDGQMIYSLSSNDIADGREEVNEREHFPLKNIAPLSDEQWSQLIGGDSVEIDYNAYGHTKIGTIKIELEQVVGTGEDDLTPSPHVTTMTGTPVETYKLTVSYLPKDADISNFHTGSYGTKRPGDDTDDIVSQNTHKINVYATPLEIEKVDEKGNLLSDAVFTLYKTDDENGSSVNGLDSTQRYIAVATATSGEKGIARLEKIGSDTNYDLVYGETYYLLETEAPSYHAKNDTVWTVTVQTENGKYTDLDGESFSSTSGITDEMYPFNWDQDAMILVNSNPAAVITNEETEGITTSDSSFVSHEDVICFRYKVENNFLKVEKEIPVKKVLKGRDMEEGEFSFVLQAISISGIRDDDSSKQVIYNPKGNANDEIEFPFTLKYDTNSVKNAPYYDTAGHAVYFYVVYEEQGEVDDIIYSDLQYIVKVTLSEEGNKLVATPEYYKYDGDGALPNAATVNLRESA